MIIASRKPHSAAALNNFSIMPETREPSRKSRASSAQISRKKVRNTLMLGTAGVVALLLLGQATAKAEPVWSPIGHANNVSAMAGTGGGLFAATKDNRLWMRDDTRSEVNWLYIGHANNVVAMAASGSQLYAATSDNRLWVRPAVSREVNWTFIGHANNVVAMAAHDGKLYAATSDNRFWVRDAVNREVNWQHIGGANRVTSMTAIDGKLYISTKSNKLLVRQAVPRESGWSIIGHANNVQGMAASDGFLFAATNQNKLWALDPSAPGPLSSATTEGVAETAGVAASGGSCRTVPTSVATSILNEGLRQLNPNIKIDHRNHSAGAQSLNPYTTGQNVFRYNSVPSFGIRGGAFALPDVPKIDRKRRIHFIQDLNTQSIRVLPDRDGVIIRASFETEGNELKGWFVGSKVGEADGRAADANILPLNGRLPFIDVKLGMSFDAARGSNPLRTNLRDVVVDMGVDANGVLEWFEPVIRPKLRDGVRDGILNAWPQIQSALTVTAGPALRREFDIPGAGSVRLERLTFSGTNTTLCWDAS